MEIMFTSNEVFDIFTGSGGFVFKFKNPFHARTIPSPRLLYYQNNKRKMP